MNYFTTDISNLSIFIQHSKSLGIDYWIFGRTLLYIFNTDTISNDKYDEIVIDVTPNALVIGSLIKRMLSSGFSLTNRKKFELLFTRHGRALIIKFLIINGMTSKIDGCFYKAKHFEGHDDMHIAESILNIPLLSKELLEDIFVPTINNKLRRVIYDLVLGRFKIKDYIMLFIRLLSPSKQMMALRYVYYFKNRSMPNSFFVIKKLSFNEFLDLNIDCSEFNWSFRSQHMNIISNGGKYKKIKDIVDYLKDNLVLQEVKSRIIDTPTNHRFNEPIYYSKSFWKTGNNFFINPIIFGYRNGVCPYEDFNKCLEHGGVNIYSREYYNSLPKMSDIEIKKMLKQHPIEITGQGFSSGRHRVCAMIGRLIRGESYIPIYAQILPEPNKT